MSPEGRNRLAALDEQGLVSFEAKQRADDRLERLVASRGAPRTAVDDQLLRSLGDLAVEVVQQHAQRRFGGPGARVQLHAARRPDRRKIPAERFYRGLEACVNRCHSPGSSCGRLRTRHQLQAVAPTKKAAAIAKAFANPPPVRVATMTITTARQA